MQRLRNVLYVTTPEAWLRKDGANIVVEIDAREAARAPLHALEGVVTFNRAGASPSLLAACAEAGIAVSHLTPEGRFLARLEGARSGNVLLRRAQYRVADTPTQATPIVRGIVAAKAANQRAVVRRALRDHGESMGEAPRARLGEAERRLTDCARRTLAATNVATLRGIEGEAAAVYFAAAPLAVKPKWPDARRRGYAGLR